MGVLDAQLRQYEQITRDLLLTVNIGDQLTVRGAPMLDAKNGTSQLDLRYLVESERGNRRTGVSADIIFQLWSGAHSDSPETATTMAESRLQWALDVIDASDDLLPLWGAGKAETTYVRGEIEGGKKGSYNSAVEITRRVSGYRFDARPAQSPGVAVANTAEQTFGNSVSNVSSKVAEIRTLSPIVSPPTVDANYFNAEVGDTVDLIDESEAVVSSYLVPGPGSVGVAVFTNIPAGVYRVRIDGNTSNLTALVVVEI